MDKTKSPGIALESVSLLECNIGQVSPGGDLKFQLGITALKRLTKSDGKVLVIEVSFDLMHKIENPPCKFTCTYSATYTRGADSNMTWDEFKDHIAIAHIIPFIREFVSNMTTRMPLSCLMLPPTNANSMVKEYREPLLKAAVEAQ